ncbi:carbohydrate ABC transporter permease [Sanguibacter antarcticus]|uniref:Carbohydrate ABC transporter membrane protein 1 (CUT1 family) n=1 Tax=Sanguibacter antarcticus TaxID=372484 RepID=A0A2A9E6N4_9MICO|nr:sugar ABC transporter permease [Sanguibacter antarcticus]PFG34504.1 carbohydrate ABC transporter membrane protein 1 (CUT1 family) [Sanguibacter antarcticus]
MKPALAERAAPTGHDVAPHPEVRKSRRKSSLRYKLVPYGFLSPTGVLMLVLLVVPVVMVIGYSTMDNVITNKNPVFVGLANYVEILTDPTFHVAVRNTLVFTITSVVAHLLIGLCFAMLLNTKLLANRIKAIFRVIYVMPWLFTVAIIAVLWRLLLNPNGVINYLLQAAGIIDQQVQWLSSPSTALLAVTFINIWAGYPFFMISLLAGLQGVPKDLYEAATVDGAGAFKQFLNVTLPQIKPIIVSMAMLDIIWTSQQFALIWMTTGGGPLDVTEMVSTYTYKLAFSRYEFSLASASAVIVLVASMVLAFFYARHQNARD